MNITALLYNAVRRFRGPTPEDSNGAAGLAPFMEMSATSLSHKVNPNYPTAHCSPEEFVQICSLTGDHSPLQAMAMQLGYALVPIESTASMSTADACRIAASAKEFGEFLAEAAAKADAKGIKDADMVRITKEFAESMAAQAALFAHLQAAHDAGKPEGQRRRAVVDLAVREAA
ncbi:hypothetical protein LJR039_005438 [Pseudorhodoferax sp. LjRoot39]|uniref:phage regulatory CII family protein n=1 Tax=Pseudorhodoferax sp. LjRoot39 TaxID=3342328 RepID=UPI003ECF6610